MDFNYLFKTQPKVVRLINNGYKKNRLSQVFLFDGAKGTPKYQAAMYLTYLLFCNEHNACSKCIECLRLDSNVHPRLFEVKPEKSDSSNNLSIKKEQIENLIKEFTYIGLEEGIRVFIIHDIELATVSASNSLLKFLEEMPDNSYGILLTDNVNKVLQTIKSRSCVLTFEKIDTKTLQDLYLSKGIDEEESRILSTLTNNSMEGLELAKNEMINNIITLVKKINQSFFDGNNPIMVMNEDGRFLLNSNEKFYHQIFMDLLITITNDRLYYMLGKVDEMIFKDTIQEMYEYGYDISSINYNETFKQVETMLEYKERLNYNLNLELMYMDLFISCEV